MLSDVTVFNIREYLSVKGDKELGEEELIGILSEFLCSINPDFFVAFLNQTVYNIRETKIALIKGGGYD